MHHAVTNGIDFVEALDAAGLGVGQVGKDSFNGLLVDDVAEFGDGL